MRSKILVNPKWLFENYQKSNISILDSTWFMPNSGKSGHKDYIENRIPKAKFFDIDAISDKSSNLPHMLPSPQQFEKQVGDLGISNDHDLCIYDTNNLAACRVYQMFKIFGHKNVFILDGGFNQWKSTYDNLIEKGIPKTPVRQEYKSKFNKNTIKKLSDIQQNKGEFEIIDARSPGRFCGIEKEPREGLRSGHIPNSKNVFFSKVFNTDGRFKSNEELNEIFKEANINFDKEIISSCGSGVSACVLMVALELIGKDPKKIFLYDGAWSEYGKTVLL